MKTGYRRGRRRARIVFAAAAVCALTSGSTPATPRTWATGSGSWSVAGNWSPSGQPVTGDNVTITFATSGVVTYDSAVSPASPLATFDLESLSSVGVAQLLKNQFNTLAVASATIGNTGNGAVILSAGQISSTGTFDFGELSGSTGTMAVSGAGVGTFANLNIGAGGSGAVFQFGGNMVTGTSMTLGNSMGSVGTFVASGGTAQFNGTTVIGNLGSGTFLAAGGSMTFNSLSVAGGIGGKGYFELASGTINTSLPTYVGQNGDGTMVQGGGLFNAGNVYLGFSSAATGNYLMTGGTLNIGGSLNIGAPGAGTFELNGGSVSASGVFLGSSGGGRGTLRVESGTLVGVSSALSIGATGGGVSQAFQSGGLVTFFNLGTGSSSGSQGAYSLSGGTLSISNVEFIGNAGGSGTFLQTGGFNNANTMVINSSSGTYSLAGGTLQITNPISGAAGRLNFTAGTLRQSTGSLLIDSTGPLGDSLTLGSAQRIEMPASQLTVGTNGFLSMSGGVVVATGGGSVLNNGEIFLNSEASLITASAFTNAGVLKGTGRINSTITNNGEIRAMANDDVQNLNVTANNGSFTLGGGIIESAGGLTYNADGKIAGRGTLRAPTITNYGTMTFSAGLSDVFGTIANTTVGQAGANGKIIITGGGTTTFYNDVTNAGTSELRVSAGSRATFLGNVTGTGRITGTGAKDFEGASNLPGPLLGGGDTLVGPGAALSTLLVTENSLEVQGTAMLAVDPADTHTTSRVSALTVAGSAGNYSGKLDVSSNNLIVDYSTTSPLATIADEIKAGYSGGAWTGNGITSSSAQAVAQNSADLHKTALGYAEASAINLTSFDLQPVDATTVIIRYVYQGDANLDGRVNALDFNAIAANYGTASLAWTQGDFNYDGLTNMQDFVALSRNFNQVIPTTAEPLGTLVPEPAMAALFGGATLASFMLRRRSSSARV